MAAERHRSRRICRNSYLVERQIARQLDGVGAFGEHDCRLVEVLHLFKRSVVPASARPYKAGNVFDCDTDTFDRDEIAIGLACHVQMRKIHIGHDVRAGDQRLRAARLEIGNFGDVNCRRAFFRQHERTDGDGNRVRNAALDFHRDLKCGAGLQLQRRCNARRVRDLQSATIRNRNRAVAHDYA